MLSAGPRIGRAATPREPVRHALLLVPAVIVLIVLFAYPLLGMLLRSVSDGRHLTLEFYQQIFRSTVYLTVLSLTFRVSLIVATFCLVLGYPLAYILAGLPLRWARLLLILVVLPFFTNVIVRTYAWMVLLGRNGLVNHSLMTIGLVTKPVSFLFNKTGVMVGMTYILLPYMVLTVYSVMRGIDPQLRRAAYSLGASRIETFLRVFLPLSLPGLLGGFVLVFIMGLGFFITPALMGGPSDIMIAKLIESEVEFTMNWSLAAALAVMLLVITLAGFMLSNRVLNLQRIFEARH